MDNQPLSIAAPLNVATAPQDQPLSIDTGYTPPGPTSAELAAKRAYKAQIGVGRILNRSQEDLQNTIMSGGEDAVRKETATSLDNVRAQLRQQSLTNLAVQRGDQPLTTEDVFTKGTQPLYPGPTDPASVFEQAYAEQYMHQLDRTAENRPTGFWTQANLTMPAVVQATKNVGTDYMAKQEILRKKLDDANEIIKNQPILTTTGFENVPGVGVVPTGYKGDLADIAGQLLPFGQAIPESQMRQIQGGESRVGLGSSMEEQGKALFRQPLEQFKKTVDSLDSLRETNPTTYATYINGLLGQTAMERVMNDLFTYSLGADFATLGAGIVKAIGKTTAGVAAKTAVKDTAENVVSAVKDMVQSSSIEPASKSVMATAAGDLEEAAVAKSSQSLIKDLRGKPNQAQIQENADQLFTYFDQDVKDLTAVSGNPKLATNMTNQIVEQYKIRKQQIMDAYDSVLHPERVPMEQFSENQMSAIKDDIKANFPDQPILNVSNPYKNPYGTGWNADIMIGTPQRTLWSNFNQAKSFIEINGWKDAHVGPDTKQGLGWYIKRTIPVDETTNIMRDNIIEVVGGKSPEAGPIRSAISKVRTAEDTFSPNQRMNRKAATYPNAVYQNLADQDRQFLQDLKDGKVRVDPVTGEKIPFIVRTADALGGEITRKNAKKWSEFNRTLKFNQTQPDQFGRPGYYFKDVNELADHYLTTFSRLPDPDEQLAYFANKRLAELDRVNREISEFRNRHRLGAEQHSIITSDPEDPIGGRAQSPFFDGMRKRTVPGGDDIISVIGDDVRSIKHYSGEPGSLMPTETREYLTKEVLEGRKIALEIYNPEQLPLKGFGNFGNTQVRYIIANASETKPLSFNHVPRRGGGHHIFEYDDYMKMPVVTTERVGDSSTIINRYKGDATVMGVLNRAEGNKLAGKINQVIDLMEANKMDEARNMWVNEHKIPWEWDDFKSRFNPKKDPATGEIRPAQLTTKQRMHIVPKDKLIVDMNKNLEKKYEYLKENGQLGSTFVDGTRSGSAARQFVTKFTGERDAYDLFHIRDVGTKNNPIYKLEPGQLMDPMPAMQRSLNAMINSASVDNYKLAALEQWIREAAPILRANESQLRYAPLHHFSSAGDEASWKSALTPQERALKDRLMGNRWKIQQLLGIPSKFDTLMHGVAQNLADWGYTQFGPKYGPLVPHWLLPKILDPVKYVRAMVFHGVMGLGSVWQFFVQQASYATMFAISPRYAISATYANMLHMWAKFNRSEPIMAALDKWATKFHMPGLPQYKPGEWREAVETMERSGFGHVGGEYINLDDMTGYRVIDSNGRKLLDAGLYPFKAAERNLRTGAWHIAFKEWRDANPIGKVSNSDLLKITDRADLLYGNMSRASASYLQHGLPSLGSQFLSFQMRMGEMFMGKRLGETTAERNWARLRMYLTYGTLFGYTSATGITGLPVGDWLRKKAINDLGYVPGDKWWEDMFMQGIPNVLLALSSGGGDYKKGWQLNFGDRFGAQGFQFINNMFRSDKPWWTITASTSKVFDVIQDLDPYMQNIRLWWQGEDPSFKIKADHLLKPLREAAAYNAAWRFLGAVHTGQWLSKNETYLGDTSIFKAAFMTITGTQDQAINDSYLKNDLMKEEQDMQKWGLKNFIVEWRRGLRAVHDKNYDQGDDFFANAMSYLTVSGYPEEKFNAAVIIGDDSFTQNLVDSTDFRFYLQHATRNRAKTSEKILGIIGDLQKQRGER